MKYYLTCLAGFLSLGLSAQDKNYTIAVSARKYSSPYVAYLQYKGMKGEVKDSVEVKDGSFTFSGMIDEPRPASIVLKQPGKKSSSQDMINFYIEPGSLSATAKSIFSNARIDGSPSTKVYIELNRVITASSMDAPRQITQVTQEVAVPAGQGPPLSGVGHSAPAPGPGVTKKVITDMNELPFEVRSTIESMRGDAKDKVLSFIKEHPSSFVSMYTINALWQAKKVTYNEYFEVVGMLDKALLQSNEGKLIFAR